MALQVKDPGLPEVPAGSGIRALAEAGTGAAATLRKVALGTAATRNVGTSEGELPALGPGGVLPASIVGAYEPAHRLVQWSSAAWTLSASDNGAHIRASTLSPVLTIPTQTAGQFPTAMMISGSTVSDLTITAVAGVTVNGTSSVVVPAGASFQLWRLSGDIWAVMSAAGAGAGTWPMVAIAGPTYTITAADRNKVLVVSTAAAFTIASDLGDGFQGSILNIGTGQPTITLGGGVTAVTDGTEPLRLNPGPSAAALFKAGGTLSILGLYRVSASFSVATASDYWTGAAGLLIPTPQAFAEAQAEQTGSPALTLSGPNLTVSGGYFWNAYADVDMGTVSIATITGIDGHPRRVRLENISAGACSVTVSPSYQRANFGAGVSIPAGKTGAFIIEATDGSVIVTFAGYGD